MFPIVLFALALVCALLHLSFTKSKRTLGSIAETLLVYIVLINIGILGLISAYAHSYLADETAQSIGWLPGSPFQSEIAAANLAFGVLGVLSFWIRGRFLLATVLGSCIFIFGAAYVHILQLRLGDTAPYNSGIFLWGGDIAIPLFTLILTAICFRKLWIAGNNAN